MTAVELQRHLPEIINTMSEGLVLIGPDGRILMVNPEMEQLTGYAAEELVGQPCSVLKCDMCDISRRQGREHWCRLFDDKMVHRRRCMIIRKDGGYLPVLKNASLLFEEGQVVAAVETLTDISELVRREEKIQELSRRLEPAGGFQGMIGASQAMRALFDVLRRAARSDAPVLLLGESGSGKELAARAIHELGTRREGPYVQLNCAALNESLLESELFGHVRGAFTGAVRHRQGRFEAAHGGDLFLDEIGDLPLSIQVKLLRVLETRRIERVGDNRPVDVDVRIITATNRDLDDLVARGLFREDFLYRIKVIPIRVPPLRERREDIPLLASWFLQSIVARGTCRVDGISGATMELLMRHPWPGNARELKSALEYACIQAENGRMEPAHLPAHLLAPKTCPPPSPATPSPAAPTEQALPPQGRPVAGEREALVAALREARGNQSEAARLLGVHRGTVLNRMRKYGIELRQVVEG